MAAFFSSFLIAVEKHPSPWLTAYAVLTAATTLSLICLGGLVTSHEAGLSVPDWPTTYGYNMFFFPISKWVGGIFYEHTHRLLASLVGFMTVVLAVWIWLRDTRPWMRWLGVLAVFLVILQGVLGGLRVTAMKDELGIFHATLAQLFLALIGAMALWSSRWWQDTSLRQPPLHVPRGLVYLFGGATLLILLQLVLGATMRHQHAGLAIPDFPAAYGRLWPAIDAESITRYNQLRMEMYANPITAFGVALQMVHRIVALCILAAVALAAWQAKRLWSWTAGLARLSLAWLGLIVAQVFLGAATIWTNKSADITTIHVGVGSVSLVTGALLLLVMYRRADCQPAPVGRPVQPGLGEAAPGRNAWA